MTQKVSLSIVMPAYNEAQNIGAMLADALRVASNLATDSEVIVVDDGSKDDTAAQVVALAQVDHRVRLIKHERNRGYGAAVFSGLTAASKDWIFFTDSDRQFVLEELEKLLLHIPYADIIVGYRAPRRDPALRRLYGWGWNRLVTLLFGYTARDIDCAFKLMHRDLVQRVAPLVRSRGATFSAEWLVIAKRLGYRFAEVPVTHKPRVAGKPTGARLRVIWRAFWELVRFRLRLWYHGLEG